MSIGPSTAKRPTRPAATCGTMHMARRRPVPTRSHWPVAKGCRISTRVRCGGDRVLAARCQRLLGWPCRSWYRDRACSTGNQLVLNTPIRTAQATRHPAAAGGRATRPPMLGLRRLPNPPPTLPTPRLFRVPVPATALAEHSAAHPLRRRMVASRRTFDPHSPKCGHRRRTTTAG